MPVQQPPPTWVISNIRLTGDLAPEVAKKRMHDACARVINYGDGWMTCCRAMHPEEVAEQISALRKAAADLGEDFARYTVSYQVTMNIGDSAEQASQRVQRVHLQLLPGAQQVRRPVQLGAHGHPGDRGGLVPPVQRGRSGSLCLPLRRP